jgi:hypothetical protein
MTVRRFRLTNHAKNAPDFSWKTGVDAAIQVMSVCAGFAAHEADTPNMTVVVDAGRIQLGTTLTSKTSQTTGTIVAPVTNPRIDRVVMDYAGAISVITGAEAATPSAPAITASKVAVCQIALVVGQTRILNSDITDERPIYFIADTLSALTLTTLTVSGNASVGGALTVTGLINGIGQPTLGTPQATTSGTSIDFTSIPSWVTRIVLSLKGVSTNGTAVIRVRLGTGGSPTTSGYLGASASYSAVNIGVFTAGFDGQNSAAAAVRHETFIFTKESASTNTWLCLFSGGRSDTGAGESGAGQVPLSGVLDMIRLTTSNGTDAFDAGEVNIWYG